MLIATAFCFETNEKMIYQVNVCIIFKPIAVQQKGVKIATVMKTYTNQLVTVIL